ncbi:MAG: PDZ domain-containing protein [Candidatus Aminicenantes bacterium]|nr:PDZ domain-containing protein [Candidatus Aminicenantes bacterium]
MRKTTIIRMWILSLVFILSAAWLQAIDINDTKMLTQPAIGKTHIAFVYANDLWAADFEGKNVRRLTSDLGVEGYPAFSPDGSLIAFSAQYEGNMDVYTVPVSGGVPKRLTWHPSPDLVQCFTPDGKAILFTSPRASFTGAHTKLFTVSRDGQFPEPLKVPNASRAAFSPDGTRLAYNPLPDAFTQWKNYRGGRNSVIWILNLSDFSLDKVPQPEGRSNDPGPMWLGDKVYFRSDRNGEFNLFSYDPKTKEVAQLTNHRDYPVLNASAGGGKIIYEQAGQLYVFEPQANKSARLKISVSADLGELRDRFVRGARWVRNADISPSGARAVFEFRGEIVTVPAEKGDPRNITNAPGSHERYPVWSLDGRSIAYFSDASGEYQLHVRPQDGKGEVRKYNLSGAGFFDSPVWAPDGQKISFADNSRTFYWIDLKTGVQNKIASNYQLGGRGGNPTAWSPDSKWIVYTLNSATYIQKVYAYSLEQGRAFAVTDGLSEVSEPVFDASGKYLYFFSSTDAGPVKQWFDMSNADMRLTSSIYVAALTKEAPNPLAKENDEEKGAPDKSAADKGAPAPGTKEEKPAAAPAKPAETFRIDFDGLNQRILALPVPAGNFRALAVGEAGQLFYLENPAVSGPGGPGATLHKFDFKTRKDEVVLNGVSGYELSADKKKIFYESGGAYFITALTPKPQAGQGRLAIDAIEVKIRPVAEWKQIFDEAWRINRDFFYATNMHGADWPAMKAKYEAFLPHVSCRGDLNRIIQWMCSELGVGHHRVGGGDSPYEVRSVPGGLLGADYAVENGRYRFSKVFGGLNWNPELRSPLAEPGVDVRTGEYLLAVNGKDLRPPANLYAMFENTAGKIVEIAVGPNPDGTGSRTVQVVPIASESALRNRDWVEGNLKKVEQATGGRVAYVYVPNTTTLGHTYFKRYFYPQADKEAIIVDERFNGGGLVADYYIDHLRQPLVSYWNTRYGADFKTPSASIQGPKVLIADEMAGSGGDLFPWMWRKFKLGPIVGKRTWGGLVGTLGFPVLMDGGSVTAPNLAIWTEDGWVVENVGVPPDVEVDQTPAEVIAGRDPQLEKAIQIVLEELKKNPPKKLPRPAYPIRIRR